MERLRFGIHILFHHNTWVTKLIDEFWYDVQTVQKLNQFVDTFNCGTILKYYAEVFQNKSYLEQFLVFGDCQNKNGIKICKYKNKWVGDEIITDYFSLGRM